MISTPARPSEEIWHSFIVPVAALPTKRMQAKAFRLLQDSIAAWEKRPRQAPVALRSTTSLIELLEAEATKELGACALDVWMTRPRMVPGAEQTMASKPADRMMDRG